ncbi:hypothetical protein GCM10018952_71730 [Streptosporangium vulgare]
MSAPFSGFRFPACGGLWSGAGSWDASWAVSGVDGTAGSSPPGVHEGEDGASAHDGGGEDGGDGYGRAAHPLGLAPARLLGLVGGAGEDLWFSGTARR